jgi:transcriptional regulator with XRE-family HTH domain
MIPDFLKLPESIDVFENLCNSMSYSEFLKRTRKAAGLTQGQLAEAISARGHKVSVSAISNIENAYYKRRDGSESQPAKHFVILAADVCGADVNEALREADYAAPKPSSKMQKLLDALSAQGIDTVQALGGFSQLQHLTDEEYDEMVRSIVLGIRFWHEQYAQRHNDKQ